MRGIFPDDEYREWREWMARDLAQASLALSQVVESRNLRKMGALRADASDSERKMILLANQLSNYTEAFLMSYYLPIFAQYWFLRQQYEKKGGWREVRELTVSLNKFRGPFSLYRTIHEACMSIFDLKFDQYHTITTMLGVTEEEEEEPLDKLTWLAADERSVQSKMRGYYAARDRARRLGIALGKKGEFPTFEEAVQIAKENMELLRSVEPELIVFDERGFISTVPQAQVRSQRQRKSKKKVEAEEIEEVDEEDDEYTSAEAEAEAAGSDQDRDFFTIRRPGSSEEEEEDEEEESV